MVALFPDLFHGQKDASPPILGDDRIADRVNPRTRALDPADKPVRAICVFGQHQRLIGIAIGRSPEECHDLLCAVSVQIHHLHGVPVLALIGRVLDRVLRTHPLEFIGDGLPVFIRFWQLHQVNAGLEGASAQNQHAQQTGQKSFHACLLGVA